jgi:hypothetical protein
MRAPSPGTSCLTSERATGFPIGATAAAVGVAVIAFLGVTIALRKPEPDRHTPSSRDDAMGIGERREETRQDAPEPFVDSGFAQSLQSATAQEPLAKPAPNHDAIMAELRRLMFTAPAISLEIARDGNARFPDGPQAAERAWFETRALVLLGRFDEARSVARRMIERYPDTQWTTDVRRHLLSQPAHAPPFPSSASAMLRPKF